MTSIFATTAYSGRNADEAVLALALLSGEASGLAAAVRGEGSGFSGLSSLWYYGYYGLRIEPSVQRKRAA